MLCIGAFLVGKTEAVGSEQSKPETLFRIGSGGVGGTYFPVAQLLAAAVSQTYDCVPGDQCGLPGVLGVAQISNGSVANILDLRNGSLEAGLTQADVAQAAYLGHAPFAKYGPYEGLRAIANLYSESVHIVVRAGSDIRSVADLNGKSVSLEEPGSGTLTEARRIIRAYKLDEGDLRAVYLKPNLAAKALMEDRLDAFFVVAGAPAPAVAELAAVNSIRLIPIVGREAAALLAAQPYFFATEIPIGTYQGVMVTPTLAVGAQLVVDVRLDDDLVYGITRAIWSPTTEAALQQGHPKGKEISLARALDGLAVPVHPGAERYYREIGLLADSTTP